MPQELYELSDMIILVVLAKAELGLARNQGGVL
jgi:hypothetical protein